MLLLLPFQMSFNKERGFKMVKLWNVDSAWGALVKVANNLLSLTRDKW